MKKKSYNGSIRGPHDWDKMLSAAYQMSLGQTRADTAKIVGVDRRTVYNWERGPYWDQALAEAHRRWCSGIVSSTKNAIAEALGDPQEYASMARFVAERMIKELRPPKHDLSVDAKLDVTETARQITPSDLDAAERQIALLRAKGVSLDATAPLEPVVAPLEEDEEKDDA